MDENTKALVASNLVIALVAARNHRESQPLNQSSFGGDDTKQIFSDYERFVALLSESSRGAGTTTDR